MLRFLDKCGGGVQYQKLIQVRTRTFVTKKQQDVVETGGWIDIIWEEGYNKALCAGTVEAPVRSRETPNGKIAPMRIINLIEQ